MPEFHETTERENARWGTFWTTLSIILHLSAIFCLIYFTPLRYWFLRKSDPGTFSSVQGGRLQKIVDQMLAVSTLRITERIQEQMEIADQLQTLRGRAYERYAAELKAAKQAGIEPLDKLGSAGPPTDAPLRKKTIPELYDIAKDIERASHGLYRHIRTVELARIQRIPLLEALDVTQVSVPEHPPLNLAAFNQTIDNMTDGKMDALKAELEKARTEVAAMVAAGQRMLDMAKGIVGDDAGATLGLPFVGGGGVTAGGEGAPRRLDDPFMGYSPPEPNAYTHEWGVGVGPITQKHELFPRQQTADLGTRKPAPGRKLMAEAPEQAEWMSIDTWYIIGPFPNPNRENIDKKFPPESSLEKGMDLDATYIGMAGKPLQWAYRKSIDIPVIPHMPRDYAIWYAYTEIYSDRERDRWTIFGSDDYGKAWMNGELVYGSGKTPHPWIPDRAYKKLHYKKGFNPVLFKLENAWGRTGFSMCIYLGDM